MIRKIRLRNWKSHADAEYSFTNGTNVIVGAMGAGKSSILQAISFALFGTFSELKRKEVKISDIVNRNSEIKNALIDLEIQNGDKVLEIKRIIEDGSTKEAVIRDGEGRLIAGTNPAQVNAYLKDVLKIDEDIFLRTIYAKQNEIDLFLQLTPVERKTRLDELMCIDKFETARKNCVKLINQLDTKKDAQQEFVKDFNIENLEKEILDLKTDCEHLQKEKESMLAKATEVETERTDYDSKIKVLRKNIEDFRMLEEKKKLQEQQLSELKTKLGDVSIDEDLQSIGFRLREIKTKIIELQRTKTNLKEDIEKHQKNALELERKLGFLEHKAAELSEALAEISKLRKDLEELAKDGNLVFLEGKLSSTEENLRKTQDEKSQLVGEISALKKALAELEATQGTCPVCSSDLAPEKKSELVAQRNHKIIELGAKVELLQSNVYNLSTEVDKIKLVAERQKDIAERIDKMEELLREEREIAIQLSEAKGKKETFAEIIGQMQQRLDDSDLEIQSLDSEFTQLNEKKYLCELKAKEDQIASELSYISNTLATKTFQPGEIEELELKHEGAIKFAEELKSKANSYALIAEEKQKRLSEMEEKKNKFFEIKDKIELFKNKSNSCSSSRMHCWQRRKL